MRNKNRITRNYPKYSHGFDEKTVEELSHKSNLNLLRSLGGDIMNFNFQQRRTLKREGIIHIVGSNRGQGRRHWEFTVRGKELLEELEKQNL